MPKMCVIEGEKDTIRGQNARGAGSWPRQSHRIPSAQAEDMAAALAVAQCPSGTSGPAGFSHLVLAHGAVEAGDVLVPLSFHHPFIPALTLAGLKKPPFP